MASIHDVVMAVGDLPAETPTVVDPVTLTVILSPTATPQQVADAWADVQAFANADRLRRSA